MVFKVFYPTLNAELGVLDGLPVMLVNLVYQELNRNTNRSGNVSDVEKSIFCAQIINLKND